ncbi:MAG TPA: autotransporter domain-containing protein [Xanthobacteraceae bacterium]|nr:autotransporter domain-containing protein [Xanthobacteraceae bacterium]
MRFGHRRLGALLASSSLAALLVGTGAPGAFAQCAVSPGTNQPSVSNSAAINCININGINVTGNVTNTSTGTITATGFSQPSRTGITINNASVGGAIVNAGHITAASGTGITGNGIFVTNNASVSGGISNSGTIVAPSGNGIVVGGTSFNTGPNTISTFAGGISNSGMIATEDINGFISSSGIVVGGTARSAGSVTISTFAGGISNSGTISAAVSDSLELGESGIVVGGNVRSGGSITISTFTGGIRNSGTISANLNGIFVGGVESRSGTITISTFAGGISNSGTIVAGSGVVVGGRAIPGGSVTISTFAGGVANSGTISAGNSGIVVGGLAGTGGSITASTFTGGISNSGALSAAVGNGIVVGGEGALGGSVTISAFAGGIANSGALSVAVGNGIVVGGVAFEFGFITISTLAGGISNNGTIAAGSDGIVVGGTAGDHGSITISTFAGGINNSGTISAGSNGIVVGGTARSGSSITISTFAGGISNSGTISAGSAGIFVNNVATFTGAISNSGMITGATGIVIGSGVTFAGGAIVNTGTIIGTDGTAINASAATSPVTIDIEGGAITGNIVGAGTTSGDTVNFAPGNGSFAYSNTISGVQSVNINSGTLFDSGAITAGGVVVNSGGTLAPGLPNAIGTLTIAGNLTFTSGADYEIQLTPGAHASATVAGNLVPGGGTVELAPSGPLGTHYSASTFSILTYGGTLTGIFNPTVAYVGAVQLSTSPTISYIADNVDLSYGNAYLDLPTPPGANQNQQNVINGINNGILAGDTVPAGFQQLTNLSGAALLDAYSHLDGESNTGASTSTFQLFNAFFNLLSDMALGTGGGSGASPGNGATGFAEPDDAFPPELALAYNRVLKKNTAQQSSPRSFDQHWTAWGSAYGGGASYNGNAAIGSNNLTASDFGFAGGMDYHAAPDLKLGFALAGGGTNWSLAQNLGTGRSDALQIAGYGIKHFGPLYFTAMAAFGNSWITTNRIAAFGDQLRAKFDGQSYGLRGESGYRFAVTPASGITPYAAIQTQWFHAPGYSETDLSGGGFGLAFNAQTSNDTRSELGARADDLMTINDMPLILRARVAWAHDWVSNTALGAVFQTLPGAAFTVNGAAVPADSALVSAGGQLFFSPNWSIEGRFDSEFASTAQTYAGTGTLKYSW